MERTATDLHTALTAINEAATRTSLTGADLLQAVSEYLCAPRYCRCNEFPAKADRMCPACNEAAKLEGLAVGMREGEAA